MQVLFFFFYISALTQRVKWFWVTVKGKEAEQGNRQESPGQWADERLVAPFMWPLQCAERIKGNSWIESAVVIEYRREEMEGRSASIYSYIRKYP